MKLAMIAVFGISLFAASCQNPNNTPAITTPPSQSVQIQLPPKTTATFASLLNHYFHLKNAFVNDDARAAHASTILLKNETHLLKQILNDTLSNLETHLNTILNAAENTINTEENVEKQRLHFEKISDALYHFIQEVELKNITVYRQYCPMAYNDKGAYWLSREKKIRNPYFGKKMINCGEVTATIN